MFGVINNKYFKAKIALEKPIKPTPILFGSSSMKFNTNEYIMVAEYWTELPPKKQLEKKMHSLLIEVKERMERNKLIV